jgi:hypothetical protein
MTSVAICSDVVLRCASKARFWASGKGHGMARRRGRARGQIVFRRRAGAVEIDPPQLHSVFLFFASYCNSASLVRMAAPRVCHIQKTLRPRPTESILRFHRIKQGAAVAHTLWPSCTLPGRFGDGLCWHGACDTVEPESGDGVREELSPRCVILCFYYFARGSGYASFGSLCCGAHQGKCSSHRVLPISS